MVDMKESQILHENPNYLHHELILITNDLNKTFKVCV